MMMGANFIARKLCFRKSTLNILKQNLYVTKHKNNFQKANLLHFMKGDEIKIY